MRRALTLAGLLVVLAGCGSDEEAEDAEPTPAAPRQTISITEVEWAIDPPSVSIDEPGTYAFEVVNNGKIAHALEIEGGGVEQQTETLEPGQRATLTVELKAGGYDLYCPIADHGQRGMTAGIEVGGSAKSEDGDGYGS